MVASGFKIASDLIVTNRHVAEDHLRVLVRNAEGKVQPAVSLPHDFPADLVLLRLEDSQPDLNLKLNSPSRNQKSFMLWRLIKVGMGLIYKPGEFAHYPDTAALPQARIHTDARALPGNSGGAVVDEHGRLLGVLALAMVS